MITIVCVSGITVSELSHSAVCSSKTITIVSILTLVGVMLMPLKETIAQRLCYELM